MMASSRTHALTFVGPLAARRLWWCRLKLPLLGMLAPSSALGRLRFIHFGGWSVFRRLPGAGRSAGSPPGMIFVSDYDGDPDEYLAAFAIGIEGGMRWTFGSYHGFPGPRPTPAFVDYVSAGTSEAMLRYSAYPGSTVRDIDTALAVVDELDRLRVLAEDPTADGSQGDGPHEAACGRLVRALTLAPEQEVPSLWSGISQALRHRPTVSPLVICAPLDPSRIGDAAAAVRSLAKETPSPFAEVAGLHFARAAVVEAPVRRPPPWWAWLRRSAVTDEPGQKYLLVCAWVDGAEEAAVGQLVKDLTVAAERPAPADALWGSCTGYPGPDDPEQLARWLIAHCLRFSLFLDSHVGVSVEQVQAALRLRARAMEVVAAHEGCPAREVVHALANLNA